MRPLPVASAGAVLASCVVLALVSSRSSSSQLLQRRSAYDVIPVAQAVPLELVNPRARRHKGTPAQANAPRIPPKTGVYWGGQVAMGMQVKGVCITDASCARVMTRTTETEKQAMMRARIEAKQDVRLCVFVGAVVSSFCV